MANRLTANTVAYPGPLPTLVACVARSAQRGEREFARATERVEPVNEINLHAVDRPNSYIGKSIPRPNARKLVEGRGQFVDDIILPRMVHVVFARSPHAHARIVSIDVAEALKVPGVLKVFSGKDLAAHCDPWVAILAHLKGMKSAPQLQLPLEHRREDPMP